MQNDIINMNVTYKNSNGAEVIINLNDICFKPSLYNTNCAIYSVLNYFQNSYELLNKEVKEVFTVTSNSSYHMQYCIWWVYSPCTIRTHAL